MPIRLWAPRREPSVAGADAESSTGLLSSTWSRCCAFLLFALVGWLFVTTSAHAACPPIANKPQATPHVNYEGIQHRKFCAGPITVNPGQNIIRLNATNLFPQVPGYITRFDPELVYTDGTVPPVDVLHLHHAVWLINSNPQFATGEEKTIFQLPQGFGWRSRPSDTWYLNDMIHDLVGTPAQVYIVWRLDFVPDTSPAAATIRTVQTRWMDVAGPDVYPVYDSLRRMGSGGNYTFPDQATGSDRDPLGAQQQWNVDRNATLIQTAGHLHPGGLSTQLRVNRAGTSNTLFTSNAHYFEPAGAVSWDVAMGASPTSWRIKVKPGDTVSVHSTYDVSRADWYEGMGIMPVAVYYGSDVGGIDALNTGADRDGVLTHGHLAENNNHGGEPVSYYADPRFLPSAPNPGAPIGIEAYQYQQGDLTLTGSAGNPPNVRQGRSLTYVNHDAVESENVFHTLTSCKAPCNRKTGIAYPIANGPITFDSGQLGFNYAGYGAPAVDRDTWQTPVNLTPGTYAYFCRVHPFMRGAFRVLKPVGTQ